MRAPCAASDARLSSACFEGYSEMKPSTPSRKPSLGCRRDRERRSERGRLPRLEQEEAAQNSSIRGWESGAQTHAESLPWYTSSRRERVYIDARKAIQEIDFTNLTQRAHRLAVREAILRTLEQHQLVTWT
jgi:hypothetical protein